MSSHYFEYGLPKSIHGVIFIEINMFENVEELFNLAYLKHTKDKKHIYYLFKEELIKLWKSRENRENLYKCRIRDENLSAMTQFLRHILLTRQENYTLIYNSFKLALFGEETNFAFDYSASGKVIQVDRKNKDNYYSDYLYSNIINDSTYFAAKLTELKKEVEELKNKKLTLS